MQRGELVDVLECLFLVGVALVRASGVADGELVEAQHVHHTAMENYFIIGRGNLFNI